MQPKKKVVTLDEGEDPLSTSTTNFIKKTNNKNAFEKILREQEKDMLSEDSKSDKKPGFVINKSIHVNMAPKDPSFIPAPVSKNPFTPAPQTHNTGSTNMRDQKPAKEVVFLKEPTAVQQKVQSIAEHSPSPSPRNPFDDPKVLETVKAMEKKEKAIPAIKPKSAAANLNLSNKDLVAGEKPLASIVCSISLMQYPHLSAEGTFIITNFKVLFKPNDPNFFLKKPKLKEDYLHLPLTFIYKFEKSSDKKSSDTVNIDIHSKDGRIFRLRISERFSNESSGLLQYLHVYAFPERKDHFFAIEHGKANREFEEKFKGWKIYNIEKEFQRQGADFDPSSSEPGTNHKFRIIENRGFKICSTYPPRMLVPAKISDSAFLASSRFRTKERVPCVTYYYAKTNTILARSSQSKPGLYQNRCLEDEQLLRYLGNPGLNDIGDTGITDVNLNIYDARPYLNAMANRVNGKGFEDTKWYRNCEIFFMDIDNIHHVRDGHRKLLNLCFSPETLNIKWYSQLESSNWLEFISYIIGASSKIASSLKNGRNCLVHCSDGWDRTAQILSLAQIMLDPYFRTIEGFEVLVTKDWVYFGHQFNTRMGHGNKNDKDDQRSPVFLQFLDCVHQLLIQYPFAFEFNQKFLCDLAYHSYSCQFGTFLCNSYQEIVTNNIEERTVSVWSYMNSHKEKYYNIYYNSHEDLNNPLILKPSHHLKHLRLWEEHFLYYSWLSKPQYEFSESISFPNDFYEYMLLKDRRKVKELKTEVEELKAKLKKYESQDNTHEADASQKDQTKTEEKTENDVKDANQANGETSKTNPKIVINQSSSDVGKENKTPCEYDDNEKLVFVQESSSSEEELVKDNFDERYLEDNQKEEKEVVEEEKASQNEPDNTVEEAEKEDKEEKDEEGKQTFEETEINRDGDQKQQNEVNEIAETNHSHEKPTEEQASDKNEFIESKDEGHTDEKEEIYEKLNQGNE